MSVLHDLRANVAAATAKAASNSAPAKRDPNFLWLNIGAYITLQDPDGNDVEVFVSLPTGITLDDMKPVVVRGTNQDWVNLAQTKNALLEVMQKRVAGIEPGSREAIPELCIEGYHFAPKDQQAQSTAETNPLIASLMQTFGKKAA